MTTITVGTKTFNLVTMPSSPGFADISVSMKDSVSVVQSPYVPSQSQTQQWPGADSWSAQVTLPSMTRRESSYWKAFLAECRGAASVFQLGDQLALTPLGVARGIPLVDGSITTNNLTSATTLFTKGWRPSTSRQLNPADYLQIGYRLYMVAGQDAVSSDASGNAQIQVFPSLREQPPDGTPIVLAKTSGLFRLASNKRDWHTMNTQLSLISFQATEAR